MTGWSSIDSPTSVNAFLVATDFFHDAVIREVGLVGRTRVQPNGWMLGYGEPADAVVIIHSQNPTSQVIELMCTNLVRFRWNFWLELAAEVAFEPGKTVLYLAGVQNADEMVIEAESVRYRVSVLGDGEDTLRVVRPQPIFE